MKTLLKVAIAVLLILGAIKTFQEHNVTEDANHYYNQVKNGEILQSVENINFKSLKNIDIKDLNPADFF
ncbi:hypothetical protein [Staphylococcus durrellii]|uniref:hypothetical protein n=1 Tax=Staphylococcus durrellii TaxID=2781773 RepID=UPI0018A08941|nr:hypothetical protein [Staphylococcus durrellii]MBF7016195.1 hypothetical protein [Staphylococcus durrellii]